MPFLLCSASDAPFELRPCDVAQARSTEPIGRLISAAAWSAVRVFMTNIVSSCIGSATWCHAAAGAQESQLYPNRHITLVAPIAPGGAAGCQRASDRGGAERRAWAAGSWSKTEPRRRNRGRNRVRRPRRARRLYALLADLTTVVGPSLVANLSYEPQRDFVPVAFVSRSFMFLVVTPSFEAKSISDLVALARRKPSELQMASFRNWYAAASGGSGLYQGGCI